ncbi:MAG: hypothetical protein A3B23_01775 [Candidatus Colwellbacteria bacterium RIFCSPLOWO2_01_FULL_48_10]|uniref:TrbC/VIRB2 family protein n=1 Tax=Candidatus Colwellbacteria bacterium RIFCSPLOWO2_01_FULL_48_10 TaxID=1797690 RepID=A0A1G1Z6Y7_9BACT|nr:MAG: hypothetical protein A3B23_01775 [Candidatus Colwellbacteria bacterium RIFCSPLOWO2_01_FULL_48_10]
MQGAFAIVPACPAAGCGKAEFLILIKNLIDFGIKISVIAVGFAVAYGGFLVLTSGGSEDKVSRGHQAITAAVIGITIVLSAWLIVNTLIEFFTNCTGQWNVFGNFKCSQ